MGGSWECRGDVVGDIVRREVRDTDTTSGTHAPYPWLVTVVEVVVELVVGRLVDLGGGGARKRDGRRRRRRRRKKERRKEGRRPKEERREEERRRKRPEDRAELEPKWQNRVRVDICSDRSV